MLKLLCESIMERVDGTYKPQLEIEEHRKDDVTDSANPRAPYPSQL